MPMEQTTLGVLDVPPEHVVTASGGRWHGFEAAEIVHPVDDFSVPALPRHVLVFNLGTPMEATERRSSRSGRLSDSGVMILPADRPRDWHIERSGEVRHLHLYLAPSLVRHVAAEAEIDPERVELLDVFGVRDPLLEQNGVALLAELQSSSPAGRIYGDAVATVIAVHLLRHYSSVPRSTLRGPAVLPVSILKRATEYIEENLAEDLSLADVARAANFSPYHFARLFKASTGTSPHQYIIRRRVERARVLLTTTRWPIAQIAHEVGFASASHLSTHFRRAFGVTPTDFR